MGLTNFRHQLILFNTGNRGKQLTYYPKSKPGQVK